MLPYLLGSTHSTLRISFVSEILFTLRILVSLLTPRSRVQGASPITKFSRSFWVEARNPSKMALPNTSPELHRKVFIILMVHFNIYSCFSSATVRTTVILFAIQCIRLKISRILRSSEQIRKLPKVARKQIGAYRQEQKGWLGSLQT